MEKSSVPEPTIEGFEGIRRKWNKNQDQVIANILPGEFYVTQADEVISTVLGSCISACVRDTSSGVGGMNHFLLPETSGQRLQNADEAVVGSATRYGNYAMEHLINTILSHGGKRKNLEVKVFGGGKIIPTLSDVGLKNIGFVLDYIDTEGLQLVAQDLGDIFPRKIKYFPKTGRLLMKKLKHVSSDTIVQREIQYRTNIKDDSVAGEVELF